jgi:hypothetical protein
LEVLSLPDQATVIAFAPWTDFSATTLYSAQLADTPKSFFTSLKLLNTADTTRTLKLSAISEGGDLLAPAATIPLPPGGILESDAAQIFGGISPLVGSLQVTADGPGVVGDVVFGDPSGLLYAAGLSLQSRGFTRAVFSQVANGAGYFTGLALYNPASSACDVRVSVFASDGSPRGEAVFTLPAGQRLSKLLPEIVKDSDGLVGGYVVVNSTLPLISQAVFGDGIQTLAAIPPTILQ